MGLGGHGRSRVCWAEGHKGVRGAGFPTGDTRGAEGPVAMETRQAAAGPGLGPGPRRAALTSGRPHLPLSEYGESPAA